MHYGDPRIDQRYWDRVIPEPTTGCWLWTGSLNPRNGYAQAHLPRSGGKQHMTTGHRLFYQAAIGPIPKGMCVDHVCHTRACVNPDHLRAATYSQNGANARARGGRSPYKGVSWHKKTGKWRALAMVNRRSHSLGLYQDPEDAALAYDAFVRERHGEYALTNASLGLLPTEDA